MNSRICRRIGVNTSAMALLLDNEQVFVGYTTVSRDSNTCSSVLVGACLPGINSP